jgi:nicotinate-nucleotide adenylyltransferase
MIGILGGTFDPPHWGHVKLAQNFIDMLKLDELLWLPAGQPWQKSSNITPAKVRYELTLAAVEDLKTLLFDTDSKTHVGVSRIELDRQGPSYTIDTAKELRALYGSKQSIVWLMGADTYQNMPTWNDWQHLPDYLHLAVASRKLSPSSTNANIDPDHPQTIFEMIEIFDQRITDNVGELRSSPNGKVIFDEHFHVDLSSTYLREQFAQKASRSELSESLSPQVLDYIEHYQIAQYLPPNHR